VRAFTRAFPKASLAISEGSSDHILEWLALGRLDVGLVFNPGQAAGVKTAKLVDDRLCLITTRTAPLVRAGKDQTIRLRDLAKVPLIIPGRPHTLRTLLDDKLVQAGLELNLKLEMDSIATIIELIRAKEGVAILPGSVAAAYAIRQDLVACPVVQPTMPVSLYSATYESRPITVLARQSEELIRTLIPKVIRTSAVEHKSAH
jgi:LysR family nitrogen assimilation transcriptional regulator